MFRSHPTSSRARLTGFGLLALMLLASVTEAHARIKLVTLPVRERVEVQLDHDHATLVEEVRVVPLNRGRNAIDFSWANTNIDPGSIVFRVLGPAQGADADGFKVNVLSVAYPQGENALVWQVSSATATPVRVRIAYLLGGLSKEFSYRVLTEHDESTLTLTQYLRVKNFAGEAFGDSEVFAGVGNTFTKPIGTQQTKQVLLRKVSGLPVTKTYTADFHRHGYLDAGEKKLNVPMHYVLSNTAEAGLGSEALPVGKFRLFQKDGAGADATSAFLGEDWGRHTPAGEDMRLYVGLAQDVVVRRKEFRRQTNKVAGNLFHQHLTLRYEIENFKDTPVKLQLIENMPQVAREARGDLSRSPQWSLGEATDIRESLVIDKSDRDTAHFEIDLPARQGDEPGQRTVHLEFVFSNHF